MAYYIDGVQYAKGEYDIKLVEIKVRVALINSYVSKIQNGVITLNDVPAEYYDEVYNIINAPVEEPITEEQAFINRLISEVNS